MTITWKINQLERQSTDGLVTVVHWGADAVDGDDTASVYSTVSLERGESFTAFDSLTESQVIGWVQAVVDKDAVEASLNAQIEAKKQPQILTGLPWAA
jgi:L-aminopeptidase/D-esterase-like protein